MARKKADDKNLEIARIIVDANTLNDMIYAFSGQAGDLLRALPRQKPGHDFNGLLEIIIKLTELQVATVTQLESVTKAIKEANEKFDEKKPLEQEEPQKH
jgi:hypothetical protein